MTKKKETRLATRGDGNNGLPSDPRIQRWFNALIEDQPQLQKIKQQTIFNKLMICHRKGIDPFTEAYFLPFAKRDRQSGEIIGYQLTFTIAHETLMTRAKLNPDIHFIENGDLLIRTADGKIERNPGCVEKINGTVVGAIATVHFRNGKKTDYEVAAGMYVQQKRNWEKSGQDYGFMLCKNARSHACRCAAPAECGGLYAEGELPTEVVLDASATPAPPEVTVILPESAIKEAEGDGEFTPESDPSPDVPAVSTAVAETVCGEKDLPPQLRVSEGESVRSGSGRGRKSGNQRRIDDGQGRE